MAQRAAGRRFEVTRWGRWVGTFVGFPLASLAARAVVGEVDSATAGAIAGAVGGAVIGAVQVGIGGVDRPDRARWIGATAAGLAAGLAAGAAGVGFRTDPVSLTIMGAASGAGVGLAQAAFGGLLRRGRRDAAVWVAATPALWALGWLVTSQVIVDAERHHAVFGSSGALVVCAVAGLLRASRPMGDSESAA
jgi:hypothetical protein